MLADEAVDPVRFRKRRRRAAKSDEAPLAIDRDVAALLRDGPLYNGLLGLGGGIRAQALNKEDAPENHRGAYQLQECDGFRGKPHQAEVVDQKSNEDLSDDDQNDKAAGAQLWRYNDRAADIDRPQDPPDPYPPGASQGAADIRSLHLEDEQRSDHHDCADDKGDEGRPERMPQGASNCRVGGCLKRQDSTGDERHDHG